MEKKIISIIVGSLLLLSFLPMSAAEPNLTAAAEDIQVDAVNLDDPIYVEEENVEFGVLVTNNNNTDLNDCNLTMIDESGMVVAEWINNTVEDGATIPASGGDHEFNGFEFNVSNSVGTYDLTARLNYTMNGNPYEKDVGTMEVNISSVQDMDIDVQADPISPTPLYIGEKNFEFRVTVTNNEGDPLEYCNVTMTHQGDWIEDWDTNEIGPITVDPGIINQEDFETFRFNVSGTEADHEVIYELTATLEFNFRGTSYEVYTETFEDIEVERNLDVDDAEYGAQPRLMAGEDFQEMMVPIENVGDEDISDIYLTLSGLPNDVSLRDSTARYPGQINIGATEMVYFRVDVASDLDPGTYEIDYELEAVREDDEYVNILEYGTLNIEVDFAPIIESEIQDDLVIEQGTTEVTFNVTFENTGNVDLDEVYVNMIDKEPFFVKAVDHYEYGDDVTEPEIFIGELNTTEKETLKFTVGLHRNLQEGEHRLLFNWTGYFYNDGSLDEPSQYEEVEVYWQENAPYPANAYLDSDYHAGEPEWTGANATLEVEMVELDFSGEFLDDIDLEDGITNRVIEVQITNHELVRFKDVEAQLMVGEGTPFFNPVDSDREYVDMHEMAQELPPDGGGEPVSFNFTVDINKEFVKERISEGAHSYEATLMITQAVNMDTNEEFNNVEVDAPIDISGYGAELIVNAELSDHSLEKGENFTLKYTIKNEGDEAARETTVSMMPNLYNNDWTIIDGYVRALASSSEKYDFGTIEERSKNTSHLEIDLLGAEDGEDVVDLHMYIEEALSAPSPHIANLYVGEINPGEEYTVSFEMMASEHTQVGKPYQENIHIEWMDTNGEPIVRDYSTTISLAGQAEESEEPAEIAGMDAAVFGVILVIIILAIALGVSLISRGKGGEEEGEETLEEMEEEEPEVEEELEEEPFETEEVEEPFEEMEEETPEPPMDEEPPEPEEPEE